MTRRLLLLNGLAALMIPLHHSTALGLQAMFQWTNRYAPVSVPNYDQMGSLSYYILMGIRQLDAFAVPAFLFVSGFFIAFMARGEEGAVTWKMVAPRIKVLLIPFVLWTAVRYVILMRFPASLNDFLEPYYYIVVLIQLYLLAPVLVRLARSRPFLLLVTAGLIQLGIESIMFLNTLGMKSQALQLATHLNVQWIFPANTLHFALGLVIGLRPQESSEWLGMVKWWLLGAVVLSLALTMVEYQLLVHWSGQLWLGPNNPGLSRIAYSILVAPCFLAFSNSRIPWSKQLETLGTFSLGIYLANIPFAFSAASIMYHLTPSVLGSQLLYQGILILFGLGGPLLMMRGWKSSRLRTSYRFAFG